MINFDCPVCGKSITVRSAIEGRVGKCLGCGETIRVPSETCLPQLSETKVEEGFEGADWNQHFRDIKNKGLTAKNFILFVVVGVMLSLTVFWLMLGININMKIGVENHKPVAFDIQGMRIGDPLTKDFESKHKRRDDNKDGLTTFVESIKIGNKSNSEIRICYVFGNSKLISVFLNYEPITYYDLVELYSLKFGTPPHRNGKTIRTQNDPEGTLEIEKHFSEWDTDSGVFEIFYDDLKKATGANSYVERYSHNFFNKGYAFIHSPAQDEWNEMQHQSEQNEIKNNLKKAL